MPMDQGVLDLGDLPPRASTQVVLSGDQKEALAAEISAAHTALIQGMRTTVDKAADVGDLLIEAKPKFPRGWLKWLEVNTPIKRRSAAVYMEISAARAATEPRNWNRIANLGVAGAIQELRRQRRAEKAANHGAEEQAQIDASAALSPSACTDKLAKSLATTIQGHMASHGGLSVERLRALLDEVVGLVIGHADRRGCSS